MKLNSQYIHKALELSNKEELEEYKNLIRNIEAVDKTDLQIFVLQLWKVFQEKQEDCAQLNEKYEEPYESYENLCDKLAYEEGWDPRT